MKLSKINLLVITLTVTILLVSHPTKGLFFVTEGTKNLKNPSLQRILFNMGYGAVTDPIFNRVKKQLRKFDPT